ncbi:MAG: hypothetical protein ACYC3W_04180 [Candidatus Nanopelagicales bacterium]
MVKFNTWLAEKITGAVGTMWAGYLFAALALISLPAAIASRNALVIVAWVAQTFLQLVLLPIIMVGQTMQGKLTEQKINETHQASLAEFELAKNARQSHSEELADLRAITRAMHLHLTGTEFEAPGSQPAL